jgi:hypothetical protein
VSLRRFFFCGFGAISPVALFLLLGWPSGFDEGLFLALIGYFYPPNHPMVQVRYQLWNLGID